MTVGFAAIFERAAARKGGAEALEALIPERKDDARLISIPDDRWLAGMTKRIFQAGFNWKVVEDKWPGFEEAFSGFDPHRLRMLSDDDLGDLARDPRIVRNPQKIATVRENAGFIVELIREHGSASRFFADWPAVDLVGLLETLHRRGSRLGGTTAQYFLRGMGKDSFILSGDVVAALIREGVIDRPPGSKSSMRRIQAAFNDWMAESGRSLTQISRVLAMSVESGPPAEGRVGLGRP